MTAAEIARLEALLEKATPGEWTADDEGEGVFVLTDRIGELIQYDSYSFSESDAALIAAMKNALPALLKAARIGVEVQRMVSPGARNGRANLAALSAAATPGQISLSPKDRLCVRTSMDHPMCQFSAPFHRQHAGGEGADPEFMVALWNAYRAAMERGAKP